ncbi:MAG: DNA-processing protein DprA [Patescibacteria group bacterium]
MKISDFEIHKTEPGDKFYPKALSRIKKPPKQLFYRGELNRGLLKRSLAVVGSRRMTHYGKEIIDRFVPTLVSEKITIISGFMYGIDTEAHMKTIENGGATIAVLGSGINICYPSENEKLYVEILEKGGVIMSEYDPDQKAQLWMYSQRNRIVAGLATLGILVIEAGEQSGSLITARLASEMDKKVFAVPGPITSSVSSGTNNLIKSGTAKLVTNPNDILGNLKLQVPSSKQIQNGDKLEIQIISLLGREPSTIDEIAVSLRMDIVELSTKLSLMSLKGLTTESGGKFYLTKI